MKQSIRIIGGIYRGKVLHFPEEQGLRPTPNRVRETLFNWLMSNIHGANCLDAFAGSGALGFEAYSRGAARVTLVEYSMQICKYLERTAQSFDQKKIRIVNASAGDFLKKTQEKFDIIFLDPPYAQPEDVLRCLEIIRSANILMSEGLVYIESATEIILPPEQWQKIKLKRAGQVVYGLYQINKARNIIVERAECYVRQDL